MLLGVPILKHFRGTLAIANILKMCRKKLKAEKIFFDKLTQFRTEPYIGQLHWENNGWMHTL